MEVLTACAGVVGGCRAGMEALLAEELQWQAGTPVPWAVGAKEDSSGH